MRMGVYILKNSEQGHPDELLVLPICSGCGEVIADLDGGNAIVDYGPLDGPVSDTEVPAATVSGVLLSEQKNVELSAYHFDCDPGDRTRFTGWMRLSSIFNLDQRSLKRTANVLRGRKKGRSG